MPRPSDWRDAAIRVAEAKFRPHGRDFSDDHDLAQFPVGHTRGIDTATLLTTRYRHDHRSDSMDVTPRQVMDVLVSAGIRRWVLMGLYGYVGYLAQPRATQDVDVMVSDNELEAAATALSRRWPELNVERFEIVLRFLDPGEVSIDGQVKQVIDLMRPTNGCHEAILAEHHRLDPTSGHRIPTLEAAMAAKYAALVSPHRHWDRKQQDAVDLRGLVLPNQDSIDRDRLRELGELVFPGGGDELLEFLQLAIDRQPFPA